VFVARKSVVASLREAIRYLDLLKNLTQRELRSRYRRSVLGWGWSLLQPALMTAVYAIMLGVYFGISPEPGDPSGIDTYAFFLLAAMLPWNFFAASVTSSMGTIVNAGGLMTRVWFPRLLLPLSAVLALGVSLLIELGILTVAITVFTQTFLLHLLPVAVVLVVLLAMFTAGIAFWLAACNVRFRDVEYITGVLMLAYFYLTPVIYPYTFVPEKSVFGTSLTWREVALANPMARFAMAFRNVFYDVRLPGVPTMLWLIGWSLVSFYVGTAFFVKRADRFAEMM
jgi:lipopolysaccharide transport system permease protein